MDFPTLLRGLRQLPEALPRAIGPGMRISAELEQWMTRDWIIDHETNLDDEHAHYMWKSRWIARGTSRGPRQALFVHYRKVGSEERQAIRLIYSFVNRTGTLAYHIDWDLLLDDVNYMTDRSAKVWQEPEQDAGQLTHSPKPFHHEVLDLAISGIPGLVMALIERVPALS